jgi:hypothetical protein
MKKSALTSLTCTTEPLVVHGLRTGKIHATQASASEICRSVGVRPSEAKVAAKALRAVVKAPQGGDGYPQASRQESRPALATSKRAIKNR